MVPMTELLPLATLVAASCRFHEKPASSGSEDASSVPRKHVQSKIIEKDTNTDESAG